MKFLRIENHNENVEEAQVVFSFPLPIENNGVYAGIREVPIHVSMPLVDDNQSPEESTTPISEIIEKARIKAEEEVREFLKN